MTIKIDQSRYNDMMSPIYDNGSFYVDLNITEEDINNIIFNNNYENLKEINKCFFLELEWDKKKNGATFVELDKLNTIYSSLFINNTENLIISNCSIKINNSINTQDKDTVCIYNKDIKRVRIKDSTIEYPIIIDKACKNINISNSIIDTLIISATTPIMHIDNSFINKIIIENSNIIMIIRDDKKDACTLIETLIIKKSYVKYRSDYDAFNNILYEESLFIKRRKNEASVITKEKEAWDNIINDDKNKTRINYYEGDFDKVNKYESPHYFYGNLLTTRNKRLFVD